jgi:hypothetical protein
MYVGGQTFRNLKIHNALEITAIFLKLCIFNNLNMVFPVVVLVFDFNEFYSEGVLHGHSKIHRHALFISISGQSLFP